MSESYMELDLADARATETLGAALARSYQALRPAAAVTYWLGELGAGKTTCVRGLLRGLGIESIIRSPTYTLVQAYEIADLTCVHVDLYRLTSLPEVNELGLDDYLAGECLLLVEWPERGRTALPAADLAVMLTYAQSGRRCRVDACTELGVRWLSHLRLTID